MALNMLILMLPSLLLGTQLSSDIESALLEDVLADECVSEDCAAPALSLLQSSAGLHRGKRRRPSSSLEADIQAPTPGMERLREEAPASTDFARAGLSLLQMGSTVEQAEGKDKRQEVWDEGASQADFTGTLSYNNDVDIHRDTSSSESQQATEEEISDIEAAMDIIEEAQPSDMEIDRDADIEASSTKETLASSEARHREVMPGASVIAFAAAPPSNSGVAVIVLCLAGFTLVVVLLWLMFLRGKTTTADRVPCHAERAQVEALPRCRANEIEEKLPSGAGYDCVLSRPLSSGHPVRLEACIEGSADGTALLSPFKQHLCVRYSAAVYCQEKDGMKPRTLALHSASTKFVVSLIDAPKVRIEVVGDSVDLFDMCDGYHSSTQTLGSAPDHWKDFTHAWRVDGGVQQSHRGLQNDEMLEFRESTLVVGSSVTLLGELRRDAIGRLQLIPWRPTESAPLQPTCSEPWRTSWEQSGCDAGRQDSSAGKTLVSDDPTLLTTRWQRWVQSSTLCGAVCRLRQSTGSALALRLSKTDSTSASRNAFAVPPVLTPGAGVKQVERAKPCTNTSTLC